MQATALSSDVRNTHAAPPSPGVSPPLPKTAQQQAECAWSYFRTSVSAETGFAPALRGATSLGPADMGATLLAIIAARRLCLLPAPAAASHLSQCIASLIRLPLGPHGLPARHYDAESLSATDASGHPLATGSGWSAGDIMRLVAGLIATAHHHPALAPEIAIMLGRWQLRRLVSGGRFRSALRLGRNARQFVTCNDLFLGAEQYAARAACLIALPAEASLDPATVSARVRICGHPIRLDRRGGRRLPPLLTPDAFCLEALEFGWRTPMRDIAEALFRIQKQRFETTGRLTAFGRELLDRPPGYAASGVLAGDRPVRCRSRGGRDLSPLITLSTKTAFAWQALLPSAYGQKLVDAVDDLATAEGWLAGRFEVGGRPNRALSLETNAVILEALHYRAFGPFFPAP